MKDKSGRFGLSSPMASFTRACAPAKLAGLALIASAALGSQAGAAVTFVGSATEGGKLRSASAEFSLSGDTLSILLSNTLNADINSPDELLSSIYFRFSGASALSSDTVTLNGSQVYLNGQNVTTTVNSIGPNPPNQPYGGTNGDVSGEFGFRNDLSFGTNTFYGVGANGNYFGSGDLFVGPNLDNPNAPNGMNYGLASLLYAASGDNNGLNSNPIIKNSVLITLTGATGLNLSMLEEVIFQYGTSTSDPSFVGTFEPPNPVIVPEPGSTAALMGLLSCGLFLRSRRSRAA